MYIKEGRLRTANLLKNASSYWVVVLYTNSGTIDVDSEYADLTQPSFSGYGVQTADWSTPAIDGDGNAEFHLNSALTFLCDTTGSPVTCYGAALCQDLTGTRYLYDIIDFSTPIVIENASDSITITNWVVKQGVMA